MSEAPTSANVSDQHVHFTRGASYLMFQSLGVNALQIVSFAILARIISPKQVGIWTVLTLVNATCLVFATWFPQSVIKYVAENNAVGSKSTAAAVFYKALFVNVVIYLPAVAGIYLSSTFLAVHLLGDITYAPLFRVLAFDIFFYGAVIQIAMAALLGLQMFREIAFAGLIVGGILKYPLIIILILFLKNLVGMVFAWVISDALLALIYFVIVLRVLGPPRLDFPLIKLFRYYLPLEVAQIVSFAQLWFDRVVLIVYLPLATLGIYNASLTAFGVLSVAISGSIGNMLFPAYSSIQSKGGMRDAIRLATRYTSFTLTPLAFGLLATAKPALTLFVGEAYVGGSLPLILFSGAFAFTAFTTALAPVFLALEETKVAAGITGVTVIVGVLAAYLLLPGWGIVGASAARALTTVLGAVLVVIILGRKTPLQLDVGTIAKTMIAGIAMALTITASQLLAYSKFMLPLYILIGAIVYLVSLRLLKAVDSTDVNLITRFLGKRFSLVSRILSWVLIPRNQRSTVSFESPQISESGGISGERHTSERVAVDRKEFEAFLSENQALLESSQKLTERIGALEKKGKQLRDELRAAKVKLASLDATMNTSKTQSEEYLRKAREAMARLAREIEKSVSK